MFVHFTVHYPKALLLAHLVIVVKVVYPDVLLHVGVIKILPEPGPITPVKVPLAVTPAEEKQSSKCQIQAVNIVPKKGR